MAIRTASRSKANGIVAQQQATEGTAIDFPTSEINDTPANTINCAKCEQPFVPAKATYTHCPDCNAAWQEQMKAENPCQNGCGNAAFVGKDGKTMPFCPTCYNARRNPQQAQTPQQAEMPKCDCGRPVLRDKPQCYECSRKTAIMRRFAWSLSAIETITKVAPKAEIENDSPTSVKALEVKFAEAKVAFVEGNFDLVTRHLDEFYDLRLGNALAARLARIPYNCVMCVAFDDQGVETGFGVDEGIQGFFDQAMEAYELGLYWYGHNLLDLAGEVVDYMDAMNDEGDAEFYRLTPFLKQMLHRINQEANAEKIKAAREAELNAFLSQAIHRG